MPADPARIAQSTVDGVVVSRVDASIKTTHANATDVAELETFWDSEDDADDMLEERWAWQSNPGRLREAVEFDGSLGLGTHIPIMPAVPTFTVIDDTRSISGDGAVRAYAADFENERYAVEMIGVGATAGAAPLTISGTPDTSLLHAGDDYNFGPISAGGMPPYHFSISGTPPGGLSFDPDSGVLSGTITGGPAEDLEIGGTPATSASVGDSYSFTPTASGGLPLYFFSIEGDLPPGLFFDPATGEISGTISGEPD